MCLCVCVKGRENVLQKKEEEKGLTVRINFRLCLVLQTYLFLRQLIDPLQKKTSRAHPFNSVSLPHCLLPDREETANPLQAEIQKM